MSLHCPCVFIMVGSQGMKHFRARQGVGPQAQQLCNTNFLNSPRYAPSMLWLLPPLCIFTLCFFCFFTQLLPPGVSLAPFTDGYSSKVDKWSLFKHRVHFWQRKKSSLCKCAHCDGGESTWMNAPLLHCPIFPYSFSNVWCQDGCEFSHQ